MTTYIIIGYAHHIVRLRFIGLNGRSISLISELIEHQDFSRAHTDSLYDRNSTKSSSPELFRLQIHTGQYWRGHPEACVDVWERDDSGASAFGPKTES